MVCTVFELIWCIKARFFQILAWYTLRTLQYFKRSLVCDNLSLLYTVWIKVCLGCTSLWNISVVNIGMYVRMIQWQKQIFFYIELCLIQEPNICSNFTFNIFYMFFPA